MKCAVAVPLALLLLLPALTRADSLRCEDGLVSRGFTRFEVRERCGAPVALDGYVEEIAPGVWIEVEEWLYAPGHTKFRRLVRFENGRVVDIDTRGKPVRHNVPSAYSRSQTFMQRTELVD